MTTLKGAIELEAMRTSCAMATDVLGTVMGMIRPGIKTIVLDEAAASLIVARGGVASFKGYRGYPCHICVSVNEEVIHGIPGDRVLQAGDLVSVDLGVRWGGAFSDVACTVAIPPVSPHASALIDVTRHALDLGIRQARGGSRVGDISHAIQTYVEEHRFSVVREYVGHGIGASMHEEPQIPNFGKPAQGPRLKPGMVLCIEPMVTAGGWKISVRADRWTAATADHSLAAHFEQTILVTDAEPEILTPFRAIAETSIGGRIG